MRYAPTKASGYGGKPVMPSLSTLRATYRTTALWLCAFVAKGKTDVSSDGDEGPDDGVNHVHPEKPFHFDCFLDIGDLLLTCDF